MNIENEVKSILEKIEGKPLRKGLIDTPIRIQRALLGGTR